MNKIIFLLTAFLGFINTAQAVVLPSTLPVSLWNAQGDGQTDDTSAIQSGVDYLYSIGGGTLLMPVGTYVISDTIYLPSHVNISGSSKGASIIKVSDSVSVLNSMIDITNADDVLIENLTLDGNENVIGITTLKGVYVFTNSTGYGTGHVVRNNNFVNIGAGVKILGGSSITVTGNAFNSIGQMAVLLVAQNSSNINDSFVTNNTINDSRGNGIQIQGNVNTKEVTTSNVIISGNVISNCFKTGILSFWSSHLQVVNNIVRNSERGILFSMGVQQSTISQNSTYSNSLEGIVLDTVSVDEYENHVTHSHFSVTNNYSYDNGNAGIRLSNPANVELFGNFVRRNRYGILYSGDGTMEYDPLNDVYPKGFNVIIANNLVELNVDSGIAVSGNPNSGTDGYVSHFIITGNLVLENGLGETAGSSGGIKLKATKNGLVTNNYSANNYMYNTVYGFHIQRGDLNISSENYGLLLSNNYGKFWFTTRSGHPITDLGAEQVRIINHAYPAGWYIHDEPTINTLLFKLTDNFTVRHLGMDVTFIVPDGENKTSSSTEAVADGYKGQRLLIYNRSSSYSITLLDGANVNLNGTNLVLGPNESVNLFFDGAIWRKL